jgi:hypothetical protein
LIFFNNRLISNILPSGLLLNTPLVPVFGGPIPHLPALASSLHLTQKQINEKNNENNKSDTEKDENTQNIVENNSLDANFTFFAAVHTHLKACGDVLPPCATSFPDTVEAPSLGVHRATTIASADNSLVREKGC